MNRQAGWGVTEAIEWQLQCGRCGKKMGNLSVTSIGTLHQYPAAAICMECLPKALDEAEARGVPVHKIRDWMKEAKA